MSSASSYEAFLRTRKEEIFSRICAACDRAGRSAEEISVCAVSKTVDVDAVVSAHAAGYTRFGENRPQELAKKLSELHARGLDLDFDMIGNLQTNKINSVLKTFSEQKQSGCIHSVSSLHLAQAIDKRTKNLVLGKTRCLLEVNVSHEASKSGFTKEELIASFDEIVSLDSLAIEGLMTMAPAHDARAARQTFRGLRELKDELEHRFAHKLTQLSCGMSDDFEIAIEEGSTLIRLGRIVFDSDYALQ